MSFFLATVLGAEVTDKLE